MSELRKLSVAVIGGGIAGAELVRCALPGPFEITVIEPKKDIECQALYPEYLVGEASLEDLVAPLKPFCDRVGAQLCNERALRLEKGSVICEKAVVEYDVAVVATGAVQNYFGILGAEKSFSVNTLQEARKARDFLEKKHPEKIVIIGSGLTGVETAFTLVERVRAEILVLEAKGRAVPQFSPNISSFVEKTLLEKGIRLQLSARVQEIGEQFVRLTDGTILECDMAIWTAGIKPPDFVLGLPYPKKDGEWIVTDEYLRASQDVFALGDSAWVEIGGKVASKTAIEAEHQAKHTAHNIMRLAEGRPLQEYSIIAPTDAPVALISLGCDRAVGVYGSLCVTIPARLIHAYKGWIDKSFIGRFK